MGRWSFICAPLHLVKYFAEQLQETSLLERSAWHGLLKTLILQILFCSSAIIEQTEFSDMVPNQGQNRSSIEVTLDYRSEMTC